MLNFTWHLLQKRRGWFLFMEKVLFGLSCTSTNQEIVNLVFDKAHEVRYFSMATLQHLLIYSVQWI